jgi:hypothetical protein
MAKVRLQRVSNLLKLGIIALGHVKNTPVWHRFAVLAGGNELRRPLNMKL